MALTKLKLPPQDVEAEKSILGSLMLDSLAIVKIIDILSPSDFYKPAHQKIYEVIVELFSKNQPIDVLTVSSSLKTKNALEEIGGHEYLTELIEEVPSSSRVVSYAKIVKEKKVLRDLLSLSAELGEEVFKDENVNDLLDKVEQKIFNISQGSISKEIVALKDELKPAYERIEKLHRKEGGLRGVTTGFKKLDDYLSGLQKSDFIILGARPSLGKTAFALDISRAVALKEKKPVGLFSLEMSREQVVDRLIAAEAGVDLWRLRTGKLSDQLEFEMIQESFNRLSEAPIFIDDTPSPTALQIRSKARRIQLEKGLALVVVDYVQLITPSSKSDNPVQQYTEISRSLKSLARELNVPVLAISQLTRAVDQRDKRIPRLSDLRETGSWEQDADVVMLIYRKGWDNDNLSSEEEKNLVDIIIAKHRNGPLGAVELYFDPQKVTFKEIERD